MLNWRVLKRKFRHPSGIEDSVFQCYLLLFASQYFLQHYLVVLHCHSYFSFLLQYLLLDFSTICQFIFRLFSADVEKAPYEITEAEIQKAS